MTQQQPAQDMEKRGKDFENLAQATLVGAGYRVTSEELVGHKKVDLLARQSRWGREWKIAVECKGETRPVGKQKVVEIWADYEPLYQRGDVDEVLIVTSAGFSPAAVAYIRERRGLAGQSFDELLDSIMDFGPYLNAMIQAYESSTDGIPHYYQKPSLDSGLDLETVVTDWIQGISSSDALPPDKPLAILGAYGIGKSSFASHLSASLARAALGDSTRRIPVLIRLGDIGGEQSLEGLLGKHFTTHHAVPGYTFDAFIMLNRRGRFVTIFDGFDEMKQMLTWREFRYNLRELNRLHDGNARVVVLGRPTAFESDEEHMEALHGIRGSHRLDSDWPDYAEVSIAQFSANQIRRFLYDYLAYRQSPLASQPKEFESLWKQVRSKHLRDISARPVQLRMLAEILPDYHDDVSNLTVALVYELFISHLIDEVIRREEEKRARLAFSKQQRREFLRDLAFWLWTNADPLITTHDLPDEIVAKYAGSEDEPERVRRDLVAGAPLDRRLGERLRFPHRSFQEYLVAEDLWLQIRKGAATLSSVDLLLNDEVADFLGRQMGRTEAEAILNELPDLVGLLRWRTAQTVFIDTDVAHILRAEWESDKPDAQYRGPWSLLAVVIDSLFGPTKGREAFTLDRVLERTSHFGGSMSLLSLFATLLALGRKPTAELHRIAHDALMNVLGGGRRGLISTNRVENNQFIRRLSENLLFDKRGAGKFGLITNRSRLYRAKGRVYAEGGKLQVHWVSDSTVGIARRLDFSRDGSECIVHSLRRTFASELPNLCFIHEWVSLSPQGDQTLSDDVQIARAVVGSPGQFDQLRKQCSAISRGVDTAIQSKILNTHRAALLS